MRGPLSMPVTGPESLGRLIQQARLSSSMTQDELAEQLGISQRAVTEIETGKATIQTRRIFEMLRATGANLTGNWIDTND
jgi:HTH-type transcriptional regulator/antitoxin HipB